jgi:hypothetical protein
MGGDSGGGGNPGALYQNAAPMEGLPIAGKDSTIGSPFEYGQFQSFLPNLPSAEEQAGGMRAPSATGINSDMLKFKSPSGVIAPNPGMDQINSLRDELAKLKAGGANMMGGNVGEGYNTGRPSWLKDPNDSGGA